MDISRRELKLMEEVLEVLGRNNLQHNSVEDMVELAKTLNKFTDDDDDDLFVADEGSPKFAFPGRKMMLIGNSETEAAYDGMELRHYFAAKAPDQVPGFFEPKISVPKPTQPVKWGSRFGLSSNHPEKDFIRQYYNEEAELWAMDDLNKAFVNSYSAKENILKKINGEFKEFNEEWDTYLKADKIYQYRYQVEGYFQWRYFYADMMIHQGEFGPKEIVH